MLLALDLGTRTGYAMAGDAGSIDSGSISFAPRTGDPRGRRYHKFRIWLSSLPLPDRVVFEEVRGHRGTLAAQIYGGLEAILLQWCESRSIPYRGIHTGTLKKAITGAGNATKDEMIAAISVRGFDPGDDNEADAIGLALIGVGQITPHQTGTTKARTAPSRKGTTMMFNDSGGGL